MKKFVLTLTCLVMIALPMGAHAEQLQYSAYSSIGFGPLEGELTSPRAIGADENGRIFVIDAASRKGLVFQSSGAYFKSVAVPEEVDMDKLCPNISVYLGMVAYADGRLVHLASSTGEVSTVFGVGSRFITEPVSVRLLDDLSLLVLDKTNGLLLFDRQGNFSRQVILPGRLPSLPNILSFDVSPTKDIAALSMVLEEPKGEEGTPEPNRNSIVQVSLFDSNYNFKSSFKVKTDESYSPLNGQIGWVGDSRLALLTTDVSGITEFDLNGNVLSEILKGGVVMTRAFQPSKDRYFTFNQTEFLSISKDGKQTTVLAKFEKESMKFGSIDQITSCGEGLAVFDSSRNDIQFFTQKGFSGLKSYDGITDIVLFSDPSGRSCTFNNSSKTVKVYSCDGKQIGSYEFDPKIESLTRISRGLGDEVIGISSSLNAVSRISKDGFFIGQVGNAGNEEGQFTNPVDAFAGPDKNFYILEKSGKIKVYDGKNAFVRQIVMPSDKTGLVEPNGMVLLPSGEIMVSDTGNNRLVVFNFDGSFSYTIGSASPAMAKTKKGDYFANIGTFSKPGAIVVNGDSIYVADRGNLRVQVLRKEKVSPKISVDRQSIDFGKVTDGIKSETITIKNTGTGMLEGSAVCDSPWIELPKKTFTGNSIKLEIRLIADKVPFWNEKATEIVINSNGGLTKVTVNATKTGKLVKLQIASNKAYVDGVETSLQVAPMLIGGSTMVPLRFIGEVLGAKVDWNGDEKKVTYTLGKQVVVLWIGKKEALVNGATLSMSAAPTIVSGKTLVPLRFIGEALGASVEWVASSKTILIYYPPK